ncbi:hypothetical protein OHC33_000897 [Knufia fluminis]|uniref:DUF6604 domain-containing protein n=1 Tax=Knufia fluminis TaxID=191047 RepID=A0AAN8EKZ5_9EURO|nr:hypothetical protein OHC33_000897 [Knufia fluminis]
MQLPDHLLRTYRRYKAEEKDVLSWICNIVKENGCMLPPKHCISKKTVEEHACKGTKKLKGRARTEARRAKERGETATENDCSDEPAIAIFDILPSVKAIASSPKVTSIPSDIATKFFNVLNLRRRCLQWYKNNTSQHDAETRLQNKKHEHPVSILEQAMKLLRHKLPSFSLASHAQGTKLSSSAENSSHAHMAGAEHSYVTQVADVVETENSKPETSSDGEQNDSENELLTTRANVDVPKSLSAPKLNEEDRDQDEYNLAQYFLYQDIEQIEEYLFLEFVRYTLDQQNFDVLPGLVNTAIDMVMKMYKTIDNSTKDSKKCKIRFYKYVSEKNQAAIDNTPLMRMQDTIAKHMAVIKAQKQLSQKFNVIVMAPPYPNFHDEGCCLDYFGASVEEQRLIEQSFVAALWAMEMPSERSAFESLSMDSVSKVVQRLKTLTLPEGRIEFITVDVGSAFTVRLNLLLVMVLRENRSVAFNALMKSNSSKAIQTERWQKFKHCLAPNGRIKDMFPKLVLNLDQLTRDRTRENELLNNEMHGLAQLNPIFCCQNNTDVRMYTAIQSVTTMDHCFVVQLLGHMWNLLREKGYLNSGWHDLDFLVDALGVSFIFQDERPTMGGGAEALEYRIWYAFGLKKKDVAKVFSHLFSEKPSKGYLYHRVRMLARFIASDMPTFWMLECREATGMDRYLMGAEDVVLVAAATVLPPILGQKPIEVAFANKGFVIKNRPELWKHFDKGPRFGPTDLLSVLKKGLQNDFVMLDFDYLTFQKRCQKLVNRLVKAFGDFKDSPFHTFEKPTATDKIKYIAFDLLLSDEDEMYKKAAMAFKGWLETYGDVGVKAVPKKPRSTAFPLPLQPSVVSIVQDIVHRRGLMKDVFTREQEWGMGVVATGSLEETVRTAWATQKKSKKS